MLLGAPRTMKFVMQFQEKKRPSRFVILRMTKRDGRECSMARIKFAYIGGGSTRAAGTMASFVEQGENFDGSEVVLIDLNEEHLRIVQTITQKLARAKGLDLTVT